MKTRKIFLALLLTLVVAVVLSVCAFAAYDKDLDLPAGAIKGDAKWVDSGYADIDAEGSGWIMIGGAIDYSGTTEAYPTIAKADAGRFYWNKTTDKGVYVVTGTNLNANWEDWAPISAANPTANDKKKLYAFASAFVDEMFGYYGTGAYQAALGGDVPADTEKSVYVNGSKVSSYTVYNRYVNTYKKASALWTNFAVTKASYDSFVAKRAELEAAGTTGTALEDALVEFVYANFAGYKMARNVKENGSFVMLTWVWKQLENAGYVFDTVEFRSKQAGAYVSTFGLALRALETKTLLFEDKFVRLALTDADRGFLYDMDNLTTFAQVKFNADGTYTGTYTEGVIDLRGFDTVTSYKTPAQYVSYILRNSDGPTDVVWFNTLKSGDVEVAGIIDLAVFRAATKLATLTIPESVTLERIDQYAFNGCKALKVIDIKGAVSADMTIVNKNAFDGVSGAKALVYDTTSQSNLESALTAIGISTATVEVVFVDTTPDIVKDTIVSDGFSIRIDDTKAVNKGPALRAQFTLEGAKVNAAINAGYTLSDYGVLVFAANTLAGETYNGDIDAILADAMVAEATNLKLKKVSAFNGPYVSVNEETGDKVFAAAITGIPELNYLSDVYTYAYITWTDGTNTYTRFESSGAYSLYDLTVSAFKQGIVNSQTFVMSTEVELWDILQKGAFAVTEADVKAPSALLTLTQGFEYDAEGKFTYLDLPLRAWELYKNASGNTVWNSVGVKVEDVATTGILWSVLVDGDDLVVVYRADPAAETSKLPKLSDAYGASAPYSTYYFTPKDAKATNVTEDPAANGLLKTATLYSPIFTADNAKKIKALVIDYGVDEFGSASLDDTKKSNAIASIAYPEGMTAGQYLLSGCHALENFTYATVNKSYLDQYKNDEGKLLVDSLVDLTGFEKVGDYGVVQNAASIKNMLLPEKIQNSQQYGFTGARALERVWTVGFDMPEAGVMDLSQTGIKTICKGYFNNLDSIETVIMPETFTAVSPYSMATKNQKTDTARWNVFGNNSKETKLNICVANWDALNCIANTFYEARQNPDYNDGKADDPSGIAHIVDYLKLTYNGETKTVLEWREDFPADPNAAQ